MKNAISASRNPKKIGLAPDAKKRQFPDLNCFWEGGGGEKMNAKEDTPGISRTGQTKISERFCDSCDNS